MFLLLSLSQNQPMLPLFRSFCLPTHRPLEPLHRTLCLLFFACRYSACSNRGPRMGHRDMLSTDGCGCLPCSWSGYISARRGHLQPRGDGGQDSMALHFSPQSPLIIMHTLSCHMHVSYAAHHARTASLSPNLSLPGHNIIHRNISRPPASRLSVYHPPRSYHGKVQE
ncbi:hypothetical protein B0T19DRAFT_410666, partial [Cercophora scortea]